MHHPFFFCLFTTTIYKSMWQFCTLSWILTNYYTYVSKERNINLIEKLTFVRRNIKNVEDCFLHFIFLSAYFRKLHLHKSSLIMLPRWQNVLVKSIGYLTHIGKFFASMVITFKAYYTFFFDICHIFHKNKFLSLIFPTKRKTYFLSYELCDVKLQYLLIYNFIKLW